MAITIDYIYIYIYIYIGAKLAQLLRWRTLNQEAPGSNPATNHLNKIFK